MNNSADLLTGLIIIFSSVVLTDMFSFSRKILWLRLSPTNHDPKVVSRFYLETVEEIGGE